MMQVRPKRPSLPPFWTLVEAHSEELLAYARRLVGDDAEDVVQDAFLRALRSYENLAHGDHLRAWLYRIATTAAFDHSSRRGRQELPTSRPLIADNGTSGSGRDFELLTESLPESGRTALRLRFIEDLTYEDMARRLGCSQAAARQRVSTAVRALRRRLT